jgi:hypothetical protein
VIDQRIVEIEDECAWARRQPSDGGVAQRAHGLHRSPHALRRVLAEEKRREVQSFPQGMTRRCAETRIDVRDQQAAVAMRAQDLQVEQASAASFDDRARGAIGKCMDGGVVHRLGNHRKATRRAQALAQHQRRQRAIEADREIHGHFIEVGQELRPYPIVQRAIGVEPIACGGIVNAARVAAAPACRRPAEQRRRKIVRAWVDRQLRRDVVRGEECRGRMLVEQHGECFGRAHRHGHAAGAERLPHVREHSQLEHRRRVNRADTFFVDQRLQSREERIAFGN